MTTDDLPPAAGATVVRHLMICNERGLHARAAAKFVKCAAAFAAEITVSRDGATVSDRLEAVRIAARCTDNLLHPMKDALRSGATLGEVSDALRDVFGQRLAGNPAIAFRTTGYEPSIVHPFGRLLVERTREATARAIKAVRPGRELNVVGRVIESYARRFGYGVVRDFTGHGIGTAMHEEPQVPNYWPGTAGPLLKPGMVFAVEPMVNVGGPATGTLDDGWSVVTADGSLSAHFEHTIAVTDDGRVDLAARGDLGHRREAPAA